MKNVRYETEIKVDFKFRAHDRIKFLLIKMGEHRTKCFGDFVLFCLFKKLEINFPVLICVHIHYFLPFTFL